MSQPKRTRFVKPCLEMLERRDQPSLLLSNPGAIAQFVQPITNVANDFNGAKNDLAAQVASLPANGATIVNPGQVAQTFAKAATDFQRMLNDQHGLDLVAKVDVAFFGAVALQEAQRGDPIDLIVLDFGQLFGLNITAQFTNPASSADNTVNSTTVQNEVTADHTYVIFAPPTSFVAFPLGTIKASTTTPPF
jgi:hypothetical protein